MKKIPKILIVLLVFTLLAFTNGSLISCVAYAKSSECSLLEGDETELPTVIEQVYGVYYDGNDQHNNDDLWNLISNYERTKYGSEGNLSEGNNILNKLDIEKNNKEENYRLAQWESMNNYPVYYVFMKAGDGGYLYNYEGVYKDGRLLTPCDKEISHISFYYETECEPETGTIVIEKEVIDEYETPIEDDTEFEITINPGEKTYIISQGEVLTIEGLDLDTVYTITETDVEGYITPSWYTVNFGYEDEGIAYVTITNMKEPTGTIVIEKEVIDEYETPIEDDTEFEITINPGEKTYTISQGEVLTIEGLNLDTVYTITETDAAGYITPSSYTVDFEYEDEGIAYVTITNILDEEDEPETGTIIIEKIVLNENEELIDDDTEFQIIVNAEEIFTNTYTISQDNSVIINNLDLDAVYTITESSKSGYKTPSSQEIDFNNIDGNAAYVTINNVKEDNNPGSDKDPRIKLDKDVSVKNAKAGDVIEYIFTVKNTGDYTLSDVTIVDEMFGDLEEFKLETLKVKETKTVRVNYTISDDDKDELVNEAEVTGKYGSRIVKDADDAIVLISGTNTDSDNPSIKIIKSCDKDKVTPGEIVIFNFEVINTGDVDLENVEITDDWFGDDWSYYIGSLDIGESKTFSVEYQVNIDKEGSYTNIAVAKGFHRDQEVTNSGDKDIEVIIDEPQEPENNVQIPDLPFTGGTIEMELILSGFGTAMLLTGLTRRKRK